MLPGMMKDKRGMAALIIGDSGASEEMKDKNAPSDNPAEPGMDMEKKARVQALKKFHSALMAGNLAQADAHLCNFIDLYESGMDDEESENEME